MQEPLLRDPSIERHTMMRENLGLFFRPSRGQTAVLVALCTLVPAALYFAIGQLHELGDRKKGLK